MNEGFKSKCFELYIFCDSLFKRLCHFPVHSDAIGYSFLWAPEGSARNPALAKDPELDGDRERQRKTSQTRHMTHSF